MDLLGQWIQEGITLDAQAATPALELYQAYQCSAHENGLNPMTNATFGRRLAERGFVKKRTSKGYVYLGLRVTAAWSP
ncbi:MAG: hypothetical protein IPH55_01390 [Betaproteobacteria bacterium]|nr:hypothetical protein [Betaproteobacteria bacterium]